MNNKIKKIAEPGSRMYLFFLAAFIVATYIFTKNDTLTMIEAGVFVLLVVYSLIVARRKRRALVEYIESVTYDAESAKNDTLLNFPLPMVVFRLDNQQVVWGNQVFFKICGRSSPTFAASISELAPGFSGKWLTEGKSQHPGLVELGGRKYQIHGNIVRSAESGEKHNFMGITYWLDVTDYDNVKQEYEASRPAVAIIVLDNYDELTRTVPDRRKIELRGEVEDRINQWVEGMGGFLRRYDRDRFIFIFEQRHIKTMVDGKFSVIDKAREVVNSSGIHATVSVSIGRDGVSYEENFNYASIGVDMALSRGGDQAVIKNKYNFEFFGGRGAEVETRTKVKSRVTANALYNLMGDATKVYIMGHKFADLDTVGAAAGLCCIARKRGAVANIVVDLDNNGSGALIDRLRTLPEYAEIFIRPQDAMLRADGRTLLVVVDTNRPEQVEDSSLLMACNKVVVIDHHRRAATYIQNTALTFHEPYASSVCELISELLQELVEPSDILRIEAEAMLSGIVMDTKNFTIRTGERTFDAAAFLRRAGADTTEVKKLLQNDLDATVARYSILQKAKLYRGIAIAAPDEPQDRIVAAQAADELLNISGVEASIVMYPNDSSGVSMSARSIGDINVQVLLEKLGGGGNKSSAGAQIPDTTLRDAVNRVCAVIDEYLNN